MADAERDRLQEVPHGRAPWRRWGPYLSERAWGTVREDYSPNGEAWDYFPHDHARSRVYRWNEDGLGGICDDQQTLCLALAFWNGRDPILKERIFGLTGPEGNHGEDAKEHWYFLDCTPTHSWMRWRYLYPQAEFPYARLVDENRRRGRLDPEFELEDTGVFAEDRFWEITADYAKADAEDVLVRVTVRNAGPEEATIDVLPTMWFRNTWSWEPGAERPLIVADRDGLLAQHENLGHRVLALSGAPELLFCENEHNARRLWNTPNATPYPKDGINDHVVGGAATVNPLLRGTKAAARYHLTVAAGARVELRLRLAPAPRDLGARFDDTMRLREEEANDFYEPLLEGATADEARVARQALAGMLWSKQFYHYDVRTWLEGDPGQPVPPVSRLTGRNSGWLHHDSRDVISMPDTWEYPWYAAWDLAFHCTSLAFVDPEFAKSQLILLCREWFMHPNGQLPAYEWAFGDVNPPVHAWAALRVFHIDGSRDYDFLERVFHKLLINFTWWVNRKDSEGNNVFEGGFLGLDNVGPFDRSAALPFAGHLEQSDGTAWMAMYCLSLLEVSLILADHDPTYEDVATKFFEHFTLIALAAHSQGLWDEQDGFFYDVLHFSDGRLEALRARSVVGLIPVLAVAVLPAAVRSRLRDFSRRMDFYLRLRPEVGQLVEHIHVPGREDSYLLSVMTPDQLRRVLARMLDESEFLSPHGVRSLSRHHRDHPLHIDLGGGMAVLDYEPGESTSGLFGGNSNWRGPIWFPINYLLVRALRSFHAYLGDDFKVECPTGSGQMVTLIEASDELARRLTAIFLNDDCGRRPVFGEREQFQQEAVWHDLIPFFEYFHGDTGAGLGASHQTGWTGLVANLLIERGQRRLRPNRETGAIGE
ncbi:MAG TPA: glucosidase [Candidatus Dormibacteraeota bacterium]